VFRIASFLWQADGLSLVAEDDEMCLLSISALGDRLGDLCTAINYCVAIILLSYASVTYFLLSPNSSFVIFLSNRILNTYIFVFLIRLGIKTRNINWQIITLSKSTFKPSDRSKANGIPNTYNSSAINSVASTISSGTLHCRF
jgi:hypothetical protein